MGSEWTAPRQRPRGLWAVRLAAACGIALVTLAASAQTTSTPAAMLRACGFTGGLVVHVGLGDGSTTAALRTSPSTLVHGVDTDADAVSAARRHAVSLGLSGSVSAEIFDGRSLPYVDNSVNLLLASHPFDVPRDEFSRVLTPGGMLLTPEQPLGDAASNGMRALVPSPVPGMTCTVKAVPEGMDEWTHFLHGPDGHVMSRDTLVGPPHHIQWVGSPVHARSHTHLTTVNVMVTSGGRLFSIEDVSPTALPDDLPSRWAVIARDAFNGIELWRRPLAQWQPYYVKDRNSYPADLHRRLVAADGRVFVTLSILGPVSMLDPTTGDIITTYANTEKTEDIIYDTGVVYLSVNTGDRDAIDRRGMAYRHVEPTQKRLMAIDVASGRTLWTKADDDTDTLLPMTLASGNERLYLQNARDVVCLSRDTGNVIWRSPRPSLYARPGWSSPTLTVLDDVVISADRQEGPNQKVRKDQYAAGGFSTGDLVVFDADSGERLWKADCAEGCRTPTDVFSVGDKLWFGKTLERRVHEYRQAHDLRTGEMVAETDPSPDWPTQHHHRCYRDKATVNYVLSGRTGIEFINLKTGELKLHNWLRGNCKFGILPANGLLYLPPEQCGCYIESKLTGFHAVAPQRPGRQNRTETHPVMRGPAYAWAANRNPSPAAPEDWPTFRHDNQRSGATAVTLPAHIAAAWTAELGGKLTAPVAAQGRIFVARTDANMLVAIDATTGSTLWTYDTGGPIDSPPTISNGMAVFGCRDGWIYALRCDDGALVWRFRAAPHSDKLVSQGRVESVWPVHGSVLINDNSVFFAAGRSSYIDGGMTFGRLDLFTGKASLLKQHYSRNPETGDTIRLYEPYPAPQRLSRMEMPGLLPDVLSSDGTHLWMRAVTLNKEFVIQQDFPPHLFSSMGFLDDSWWELSYWLYGEHMFGGRAGVAHAVGLYPTSRIMVCGENNVYGYQYGYERSGAPRFIASAKTPVVKTVKRGKRTRQHLVPTWAANVPIHVNGLVLAGNRLFMAGPPEIDRAATRKLMTTAKVDAYQPEKQLQDALDTFAGKKGGKLLSIRTEDGSDPVTLDLTEIPVFDGLIAANHSLVMCTQNGKVICFR